LYKNYWLRRKAVREDIMVDYSKGWCIAEDLHDVKPKKQWKRVEILSQNHSWIIKDDYRKPCGDWTT
jgi:hypothetical protein